MILQTLFSNPILGIAVIVSLLVALSVHEFMHAKMADYLGDPTPGSMGRLTLNPLAHLDPLGTMLLIFVGFGWGKPVPFDPYNLENPKRDAALIAFAGPASNFVMAIAASIILRVILATMPGISLFAGAILTTFIGINVMLGIFNMLPFSPLDGFKIVGGLLSDEQAAQWYSMERYGIIFLLFFIFPLVGGRSMLDLFVSPIIQGVVGLLLP